MSNVTAPPEVSESNASLMSVEISFSTLSFVISFFPDSLATKNIVLVIKSSSIPLRLTDVSNSVSPSVIVTNTDIFSGNSGLYFAALESTPSASALTVPVTSKTIRSLLPASSFSIVLLVMTVSVKIEMLAISNLPEPLINAAISVALNSGSRSPIGVVSWTIYVLPSCTLSLLTLSLPRFVLSVLISSKSPSAFSLVKLT